jgi:hypothetical protein
VGKLEEVGRMEDRIERLERLVEELVEEVRELKELLRLAVRQGVLKVRGGDLRVGVRDLSEGEVMVLREFLEWARGKWHEWKVGYEEGKIEGYDSRRGLVLLRRGTMNEFLDLVRELGYSKERVFEVLGGLGILRYWESGGKRQYCIAVRVDKPARSVVSGYYVLVFKRVQEVSQELQRSFSEGVSSGGEVSGEFVEGGIEAV